MISKPPLNLCDEKSFLSHTASKNSAAGKALKRRRNPFDHRCGNSLFIQQMDVAITFHGQSRQCGGQLALVFQQDVFTDEALRAGAVVMQAGGRRNIEHQRHCRQAVRARQAQQRPPRVELSC